MMNLTISNCRFLSNNLLKNSEIFMKLKEYLDENGIKYGFFSKQLGISPRTLFNIMQKGTNKFTTISAIEKLTKGKVKAKDLKPIDES